VRDALPVRPCWPGGAGPGGSGSARDRAPATGDAEAQQTGPEQGEARRSGTVVSCTSVKSDWFAAGRGAAAARSGVKLIDVTGPERRAKLIRHTAPSGGEAATGSSRWCPRGAPVRVATVSSSVVVRVKDSAPRSTLICATSRTIAELRPVVEHAESVMDCTAKGVALVARQRLADVDLVAGRRTADADAGEAGAVEVHLLLERPAGRRPGDAADDLVVPSIRESAPLMMRPAAPTVMPARVRRPTSSS
jgi:hypothetical protein